MRREALLVLLAACAVSADTWIWSEPSGYSPQPRFEHTANRIGNKLFVFGGTLTNEVLEADVHILRMDTEKWEEPAMSGTLPGPTMGHASLTDGELLYVFFGSNGHTMTNRVFQFNTKTNEWQRVVARGRVPSPRTYHSVVSVGSDVYVFGGFDGRYYLNDLHKWSFPAGGNATDPPAWVKLQPSGDVPDVRAAASLVAYGNKLYLFGGFEVAVYKNDFYELDLDTLVWSRVRLASQSCAIPAARAMATLTLVGTRLVLFGGIYCSSSGNCTELADVHQFDIFHGTWTSDKAGGIIPPARYGHSATLFGTKVLIFGGAAWPNLYNDIFMYDVYDNEFSIRSGLPPYSRKQHSLHHFLDENGRSQLVVYGGKHGSGGYSNHLHYFDLDNSVWTHPENQGFEPNPQGHHASVVIGSSLYVFGGYNGTHSSNDVYICDLYTQTWARIDVDGDVPPPSHGHQVIVNRDRFLQFGGVDCHGDACTFFNEVHTLTIESLIWSKYELNGTAPRPRASHSWTTLKPNQHYVFGGIGPYFGNYNDLYILDEPNKVWGFIDAKGTKPSPRFGHAALAWNGNLLVFGGGSCRAMGDCQYFNDAFIFVPQTTAWARLDVQGSAPSPRLGHAAVAVGRILYFHGGATNDRIFGELLTIESDATVPSRSIVYGFGKDEGIAGKNVKFFVQLQDSYQRNRTSGGDKISVKISPSSRAVLQRLSGNPIRVAVSDMYNGLYKVEYLTEVADKYDVTVSVNGVEIPKFSTVIKPDVPSPLVSHSKGPGLSTCIAGQECDFTIELIDSWKNRLTYKSHFDVQFNGPKRVLKKTKDSGDGVVKVTYTPEKAGQYLIHVRVRGLETVGSPFSLTVSPNIASADHSRSDGPGLQYAVAGRLGVFTVSLFDRLGNALPKGGDVVKAELSGPDELACAVKDNNNGTYSLSYTATHRGTYKLSIAVNDDMLEGSPFSVLVDNSAVSAASTFAYGTGLRHAIAGYKSYFTIQGADDFGNNMTRGGAQLNVLFAGPGDKKIVCDVVDHGDGKYTVSYVSTIAGDFMISATLWNQALGYQSIHLSPFLGSTSSAGADPEKSYIFIEDRTKPLKINITGFSAVMGVHNYFRIQAVDRYGNHKSTGGDHFTAEIEGPILQNAFVSDNGDGTYTSAYVAPTPGKYWLKVFYGNIPLMGTPIQVNVQSNFDGCPNDCSGNGACLGSSCLCKDGFVGADCAVETGNCLNNCNSNGACLNNTCFCFPGYAGPSCDQLTSLCPNDCSKNGECVEGHCNCDPGYEGLDCSDNSLTCLDSCSGNGECVSGKCLCYPGFKGDNCGTVAKFCPKGCSGRGQCLASGMCSCHYGFTGLDCADTILPSSSLSQSEKKVLEMEKPESKKTALQPELPARLPRRSTSNH